MTHTISSQKMGISFFFLPRQLNRFFFSKCSAKLNLNVGKLHLCRRSSVLIPDWVVQCVSTDLVLRQRVVSTEELEALADTQKILTPPRLLLRRVGGQPLLHRHLHQLRGGAGRWHLQTGRVLQDKNGKWRDTDSKDNQSVMLKKMWEENTFNKKKHQIYTWASLNNGADSFCEYQTDKQE